MLGKILVAQTQPMLSNMLRLAVPPKTTADQAHGTARLLIPMAHADSVITAVKEIQNCFTKFVWSPLRLCVDVPIRRNGLRVRDELTPPFRHALPISTTRL
jgi:hypothetical protein